MTTTLWFQKINCRQLLFGLLCYFSSGPLEFLAPEFSPRATRLIDWLARRTAGRISGRRHVPEIGRLDGKGRARVYRREQFMLAASKAFANMAGPIPLGITLDEFRRLLGSYMVTKNRDAICFITMVEGESEGYPGPVICHLAFPALGRFTAKALAPYLNPGFRIISLPSVHGAIEWLRFIPGHPRHWLSLLNWCGVENSKVDDGARAAGVVLEQAYWHSLRHYPASGHMYWVESSALPAEQVVLYCDRSDTPCDEALKRQAEAGGFGWVDGTNILRHHEAPCLAVIEGLRAALPLLPFSIDPTKWLRWMIAASGVARVACYRRMLRRHNVVAVHHFTEFSPEAIALCLAARREDVLTVWNIWSLMPLRAGRYNWAVADLILAWGPLDRSYHRACGFQYRAIVEVGMIDADGVVPEDDAVALALRTRLHPDVHFVISAFDTSVGPYSHNSQDHARVFFDTILDLVERHPHWGLIIKPKKRPEEANLPELADRVLALEQAGRCLILGFEMKAGAVALAGDLVVGFPINSAAQTGALRGRPTLHLDLTGMVDGPLHDSGKSAGIVYTDVASFASAVERVAQGNPAVADQSIWTPLIDRFNDGRGRQRAGLLVGDYVRARQTMPIDQALNSVLGHYGQNWGVGYITTPDMPVDDLWQPIAVPSVAMVPCSTCNDLLK